MKAVNPDLDPGHCFLLHYNRLASFHQIVSNSLFISGCLVYHLAPHGDLIWFYLSHKRSITVLQRHFDFMFWTRFLSRYCHYQNLTCRMCFRRFFFFFQIQRTTKILQYICMHWCTFINLCYKSKAGGDYFFFFQTSCKYSIKDVVAVFRLSFERSSRSHWFINRM